MDIDLVVLWVDGNDPVWQAEKAKYQEGRWTKAIPSTASGTGA